MCYGWFEELDIPADELLVDVGSCSCRGKDGRSPCPNDLRADVPRVQHDSNRAKD